MFDPLAGGVGVFWARPGKAKSRSRQMDTINASVLRKHMFKKFNRKYLIETAQIKRIKLNTWQQLVLQARQRARAVRTRRKLTKRSRTEPSMQTLTNQVCHAFVMHRDFRWEAGRRGRRCNLRKSR
jgi:hypothetical protein